MDYGADHPYASRSRVDWRTADAFILPGWARVADFVAIGLTVVALVVSVSGGFRTHVGDWSVNLTSPLNAALFYTWRPLF